MFAKLPRSYDEVAAALSFFQDGRWRRAAVGAVGASPRIASSTSPAAPDW